ISVYTENAIGADRLNYSEGSTFAACPLLSIYPRSDMAKADANFMDYANKVKLPDGVIALPQMSFMNCTGIKEVTLGKNTESVGSNSFSGCTSLASITMPEGVKVLTEKVFFNCKQLKDVVVSSTLNTIYNSAFSGCELLETITPSDQSVLPYTVQFPASCGGVQNSSFNGCKAIKYINILTDKDGKTNFKTLGSSAFKDCKNLCGSNYGGTPTDTISLPAGLLTVQQSAFENCSSLVNMVLEGNVTTIGDLAFSGCESMARITVNPTLKQIGSSAFKDCKSLKNPPQTVDGENALSQLTKINDNTFENCTSFESIVIPKNIASIGASAFRGCTELKSVLIEDGSALYEINANAFQNCTSMALFSGVDKNDGVSYFPVSIITIKTSAFDNTGLTSIKITKPASSGSMNVIEQNAFSKNKQLEKVDLSEANMTKLDNSLFQDCTNLKTVILPDSTVASIGQNAFNGCTYLHTFGDKKTPEGEYVIPESVSSIGANAFTNNYCMQKITFPSKTSSIDLSMFNFNIREQDIIDKKYTPIEAIVVSPDNVNYTSIDGVLFNKEANTILEYPFRKQGDTYEIPESVTTIYDSAFSSSRYLKEIDITPAITSIGKQAFYNCYQLEKVNFGENDSVTLGSSAVSTQLSGNVLTFYGMTPSTAETYANQNRINFVALNESGQELKVAFKTNEAKYITDAMITFDDADKTTVHTEEGVFELPLLSDGSYKMVISAKNFATRTYEITVKDHQIEDPNITLNLLGDITGDGKLTASDLLKAKSHIKNVSKLTGYEFDCANVDGKGDINASDLLKMKSHIKNVNPLW
ncbi:MAG: leucine-rich repeat protein, partial [Ruminococcus sp.]|nr:leucine-rich repeat protein [Ruminococcus sp.]